MHVNPPVLRHREGMYGGKYIMAVEFTGSIIGTILSFVLCNSVVSDVKEMPIDCTHTHVLFALL